MHYFQQYIIKSKNRGCIVAMVTRLWDGQPMNCGSFLSMCKRFLFKTRRLALGPTQPRFQWVLGALSPIGKVVWAWRLSLGSFSAMVETILALFPYASMVYKDNFVLLFRKGHELHRLLQLKTSTCAVNISETCQIVICLDLAASVIGVPFEKVC